MNWQDHLAQQESRRATRRNEARQKTEKRRQIQARCVTAFLPKLADTFRQAVEMYNQAAGEKASVEGPRKRTGGEAVDMTIDKRGFSFQDSGKGFVRIHRIEQDHAEEYAFLQPLLNRAGDLVGWQEKQVFPGGKTLGRSLDTLTEYYLMTTIRQRLVASS